jgi:hypothetical protein
VWRSVGPLIGEGGADSAGLVGVARDLFARLDGLVHAPGDLVAVADPDADHRSDPVCRLDGGHEPPEQLGTRDHLVDGCHGEDPLGPRELVTGDRVDPGDGRNDVQDLADGAEPQADAEGGGGQLGHDRRRAERDGHAGQRVRVW